jgi:hypothetical protein
VAAVLVGLAVYLVALVLVRALGPEEWALLRPLLPDRVRAALPSRRSVGG